MTLYGFPGTGRWHRLFPAGRGRVWFGPAVDTPRCCLVFRRPRIGSKSDAGPNMGKARPAFPVGCAGRHHPPFAPGFGPRGPGADREKAPKTAPKTQVDKRRTLAQPTPIGNSFANPFYNQPVRDQARISRREPTLGREGRLPGRCVKTMVWKRIFRQAPSQNGGGRESGGSPSAFRPHVFVNRMSRELG